MEKLFALQNFILVSPKKDMGFTDKRRANIHGVSSKNPLCKWCGLHPRPTFRHHYCSEVCATSCHLSMSPQTRAGCAYLLIVKQNFKCNICGYSYLECLQKAMAHLLEYKTPTINFSTLGGLIPGKYFREDRSGTIPCQVDHIIRISEGGQGFGFTNLQALCIDCHKVKTKKDKLFRRV